MINRIFALDVSVLEKKEIFDAAYRRQRPERQARVDRMRFENGKRLCLGSGIVTEHALAYAGCLEQPIILTPEGKPTVEGCFFNLSDTDEVAVCAVSDREVGIDIERSARDLNDAVIRKAFTENEIRAADGADDYFIRLWTVKESVMKWCGLGLGLMPEHIDITLNDDIRVRITDHPELAAQAERLHFSIYTYKDYKITVCSEYEHFADAIEWIDPM